MKNIIILFLMMIFIYACNTSKPPVDKSEVLISAKANDTVKIANKELEYEIIIIDPGFNTWLITQAQQRGYYTQEFLENRNYILVTEWNNRVLQPRRYRRFLYEWQINYDPDIDYGYEVNYLLYNYFVYFQLKYNQRLSNFIPRI